MFFLIIYILNHINYKISNFSETFLRQNMNKYILNHINFIHSSFLGVHIGVHHSGKGVHIGVYKPSHLIVIGSTTNRVIV